MPAFPVERQIELRQLRLRLREIYETLYSQRQPISGIEYCVTGTGKGPERAPKPGWNPFQVGDRWGGCDQTTWFRMRAKVPPALKGETVVALVSIALDSYDPKLGGMNEGGEALVYVNGQPFQGLDRNRDELLLVQQAKGGETFDLVLEACPSTRFDLIHTFRYADLAVRHAPVWDFYWDGQVVLDVVEALEDNYAPRRQLQQLLYDSVMDVDLQHKGEPAYFASIARAQKRLRKGLKQFETSYGMGRLTLAGHAHIDTAWLWPLRETQRKCARTFSTVLNLMDRYPEFHFSCSQPLQYEWMKEHYPELFARIAQRVEEGRWELCGAPWIEPDHNVPSGESLIRQYLYGNRWFEREFGKRSHIAWVPDSFGYTWSLPQIMVKAGLKAFVTTKISWNMFTQFPYGMFHWAGIDGTRIFALMPPLNYNGDPEPKNCIQQWNLFRQKEWAEELPFAYGWGDGGGGPTMKMIEHGRRLRNIVGVPKCEFGRLTDCVDRMRETAPPDKLPVYNGELYLELHRACQTTHGRTKRHNRDCETMLHNAELLSTLAHLEGGGYDAEGLWEAWKPVLTNQFHDILPGSSVHEVYTTAEAHYEDAKARIQAIQDRAADHLIGHIDTQGEGQAVVVFNGLSWVRDDVVTVRGPLPPGPIAVRGPQGEPVPSQRTADGALLFEAYAVPPLGHAVYHLVPGGEPAEPLGLLKTTSKRLENDFLRIHLDKNGALTRVYDKVEEREVLPKGQRANVLQLFDDRPWEHDAWDIDHNFEDKMWEPGPPESVEVIERGPVRAVVRVVRRTEKSTITQDIVLHAMGRRLDFVTHVDWHEKRTLLKVAFPVDIHTPRAAFEIQFGAIERATHANTEYDRARFEVTAHRWADLSEADFGVSLLNNAKYGHDVKENVLRLSLLRSSIHPDPHADEGEHHFTYALYSHPWGWQDSTVQQGHELNNPLIAVPAQPHAGPLPAQAAFASVDVDNAIIDTVKRHEDSDAVIVRLYEACGQRGEVEMTLGRAPKRVTECDLMEENDRPVKHKGHSIRFYLKPFEIRTFKIAF